MVKREGKVLLVHAVRGLLEDTHHNTTHHTTLHNNNTSTILQYTSTILHLLFTWVIAINLLTHNKPKPISSHLGGAAVFTRRRE